MKYRIILEEYQVEMLKKNNRIPPQDIFCELELSYKDKNTKIECFLYEFCDQLTAWSSDCYLEDFDFISYKDGYEIILFNIASCGECYKIDFLNGTTFELTLDDIKNFANQTRDILLECMKIWYSEEEINTFESEML